MSTYMGLIKKSLYIETPSATTQPTTASGALWSSTTFTSVPTTQYWSFGYHYQTGMADVKTACLSDPLCDWLAWNGYDGMLFVVNFVQNSSTLVAAGWYAVCFPNPIGN